MRCVEIEDIAPDAANRCLGRVCKVSSSTNFINAGKSCSSGSSAVAESLLLKRCNAWQIGRALLMRASTAWRVKTLSLYSPRVAKLVYSVSANSLMA